MKKKLIVLIVVFGLIIASNIFCNFFDDYSILKKQILNEYPNNNNNDNEKSILDMSTFNRIFVIKGSKDRDTIKKIIMEAKPYKKQINLKTTDIIIQIENIKLAYTAPFIIFHDDLTKLYKLDKPSNTKLEQLLSEISNDNNKN